MAAAEKPATSTASDAPRKPTAMESLRETVDSIVVAFILAFMFRTFEAEAFVIPTGSMALTLMGAHKELDCPRCGYRYRISASSENAEGGGRAPQPVVSGQCPNCRYRYDYVDSVPPTFNGDRILVTKYSYELHDPQRFDVAVFKNPSNAQQNYIKRVVGLPGEDVMIYRGDVYHRPLGAGGDATKNKFTISRKPHDKVTTVMQTVYDQDYVLAVLEERGWPSRWRSEADAQDVASAKWVMSSDKKTFRTRDKFADEAWLRYQHVPPSELAWRTLAVRALNPEQAQDWPRPQLVSDFCEYNSYRNPPININSRLPTNVGHLGLHWCGDLILECELEFVEPIDSGAEAVLELVEGGRAFQCRIDANSGDMRLSISGVEAYQPRKAKAVSGRGPHRIRFANVDDQLLAWVNDEPVEFEGSTTYQSVDAAPLRDVWQDADGQSHTRDSAAIEGTPGLPPLMNDVPTTQDLESPVGIAARGAGLSVAHLRVLRDVYYIADRNRGNGGNYGPARAGAVNGEMCDYRDDVFAPFRTHNSGESTDPAENLRDFMSDVKSSPQRWKSLGAVSFRIEADRFFVLGDNSPESSDGRLWGNEYFVRRELMIGKALFVYWPHALETIPGTSIPFPFFPNFGRMRLIR